MSKVDHGMSGYAALTRPTGLESLMQQSMRQSLYSDAMYQKFLATAGAQIPEKMTIKAARAEIAKTGEALFQALRDKYMKVELKTLPYEPACFAGGTLVHTKNGLVPIERIQVGDWVLSKHESGEGEREYKRVTQTFVHEDREVMMITIGGLQEDGADRYYRFIVTPEHPIWVQGKGWRPVGKLKWMVPFWYVEWLISDTPRVVSTPLPLVVTDQENVAWFPGGAARSALNYRGGLVNVNTLEFMSGLESISSDAPITSDLVYKASRIKPEHLFRTTVYNLEVEDFHTYYVGESGLWVHNKLSTVTAPRKVGDQVFPAPGELYLAKEPQYSGLPGQGRSLWCIEQRRRGNQFGHYSGAGQIGQFT